MRLDLPLRKEFSYKPNPDLLTSQLTPPQRRDLAIPTRYTDTLVVCVGGHDRSPRLTLATRLYPSDTDCVYLVGGIAGLRNYLESYSSKSTLDSNQADAEYSKAIREITGRRRNDYFELLCKSAIRHVIVATKYRFEPQSAGLIGTIIENPQLEHISKKADLSKRLHLPLELLERNFPESLD